MARTMTLLSVSRPRPRREAAVDLDLVEAQLHELRQRRIAGAEIVECDTHAGAAQILYHLAGDFDVADRRAFGDFDFQAMRREAGLGQDAQDAQAQRLVAQLARRHVDGQHQMRRPLTGVFASLTQQAVANSLIRPVSSAIEMNTSGDTGPKSGASTARQHFEADNGVVLQRDQRLIVRRDRILGQRGRSPRSIQPRVSTCSFIDGSKNLIEARPDSLA